MKKCPCCGTISDRHTIGGEDCLGRRLKRSEKKQALLGYAIWDFRHAVLHDTYITDEVRDAILEHLDTALTENQYEETT